MDRGGWVNDFLKNVEDLGKNVKSDYGRVKGIQMIRVQKYSDTSIVNRSGK